MTKYAELMTPFTLKHGAVLNNRIAMAPMVALSSELKGYVSEKDLEFYAVRSEVAGMIITGAVNVSMSNRGSDYHLSIADDTTIDGLKKLAATIKKDGSKAIIQLFHSGMGTQPGYAILKNAVSPLGNTPLSRPFRPTSLAESTIDGLIKSFGQATRRAIEAGFDGVEIHGANRNLLQQFFSPATNQRQDRWGGSLDKRMRFPLAVVYEVNQTIMQHAPADFILGYRFSPEEITKNEVGYTIDDSLQLIDRVADYGVDYIHTSLFTGYNAGPAGYDKSYGQLVKETVGDRTTTIIVSNISSADDALDALNHGDIAAIGREALIEPRFAAKIAAGKADTIRTEIEQGDVEGLKFSQFMKDWFILNHPAVPQLPGAIKLRKST